MKGWTCNAVDIYEMHVAKVVLKAEVTQSVKSIKNVNTFIWRKSNSRRV